MAFTCTVIHEFNCVTTIIVNFMNEYNKDRSTVASFLPSAIICKPDQNQSLLCLSGCLCTPGSEVLGKVKQYGPGIGSWFRTTGSGPGSVLQPFPVKPYPSGIWSSEFSKIDLYGVLIISGLAYN